MKSPEILLDFWFAPPARKRWFSSTDSFDAMIRIEFEPTARTLAAGPQPWEGQGPPAHLALILALDQFPRNMYRDTASMFAWDPLALASAKRLIESGGDLELEQDARPFAYMPFMHSEALADQDECVRLCDARLEETNTLKFAQIHRDIILRFGRFPHRNPILGRETTEEEQAFLDDGGFSG